jgi:hypothetical protein
MVNNEPAGLTPAQLRLKEGEYELKIVAPTYKEWTTRVNVKPGERFTIPQFALEPVPVAEVILNSVTDAQIGRDAFIDAGQIVRLRTYSDRFQPNDDINAIVYLTPRSAGIRDLSMNVTIRFDRVGNPPAEIKATQPVDQAWPETFIRGCAPGYALDPNGTNTPLTASIFVDDVLIRSFSFTISPGQVTRQTQCDDRALPGASTAS